MRYKIWFIFLAAWLLVACSKESEQTVTPSPVPTPAPTPTPGPDKPDDPDNPDPTPNPPVVGEGDPMWLVATTRAGVDDDNEAYSPIQIFLISGASQTALTSKPHEGQFLYDGGWYSTIGLKEDPSACIYGFSPAEAASCEITPLTGSSYHPGAIMTMKKVNPASGDDLCVIVGVKHAETAIDAKGIPTRGQFAFDRKSDNYIGLLLDHLFARIDFKVKVGQDYSKRRHVKIKKLELQSANELTDVTVKLTAGSSDFTVDYNTKAVADGTDMPTGIVYDFTVDPKTENKNGVALTTDGTIFPSYFAPDKDFKIAKGLSLITTYDVYIIDANNKIGSRVRENCVAVNSLKDVNMSSLSRGKKTTLTLTVEPTYLYQLSDDELDNPGIKIIEN